MKKPFLLLAVLFLVAANLKAQPQLEKGNFMLGVTSTFALGGSWGSELMSFSFTTTKYKYGSDPIETDYKSTSYNVLPKAGYFVMDNLVAGIQVVISGYSEKEVASGNNYTEVSMGLGPFVRYYYPHEKVYPFIEGEAILGTDKEYWYNADEKSPFVMLGVSLGASLPLGDKVTFDVAAGYLRTSYKDKDGENDQTIMQIFGGYCLRMGFSVYL